MRESLLSASLSVHRQTGDVSNSRLDNSLLDRLATLLDKQLQRRELQRGTSRAHASFVFATAAINTFDEPFLI
jgi:cell division protein ZapA (FtsZ GTPase activity inhibitor)